MRLWNLLEGRCAYIKRLQGEGELVRWSADGDRCDPSPRVCDRIASASRLEPNRNESDPWALGVDGGSRKARPASPEPNCWIALKYGAKGLQSRAIMLHVVFPVGHDLR